MIEPGLRTLSRRLSFKQARMAVSVAVVLGLFVVGLQVLADLRQERERLAAYGEQILTPVVSSLSRAAYRLDSVVAGELARGIIKDPSVSSVRVIDDFGDMLAEVEAPVSEHASALFSFLVSGSPLVSEVPLVVQPENRAVGTAQVTIDPGIAAAAFSDRTVLAIGSGIAKSMVLAVALTALFYVTVTGRIERMAASFGGDNALSFDGGDELDDLARSIEAWRKDREAAARDLQIAADRAQLAGEVAKLGIWEYRADEECLFWDAGMHRVHGTDPADFDGSFTFWSQRLHPEDRDDAIAAVRRALQHGTEDQRSFRIIRPNGETATIRAIWRVNRGIDGQQRSMIGVNIDISEEEVLRAELDAMRRVESLGALSAGVAHDFNNLLAVIMGNMELVEDLTSETEVRKRVSQVLSACEQGSALTKLLLAFGRRSHLEPKVVEMNALLDRLVPMLSRTLPETIQIEKNFAEPLPPIKVDPALFETAILNLVINSRDAMTGDGTVRLETSEVVIDELLSRTEPRGIPKGHYVSVVVEDTGSGIAPATLARIFEPFFSTKAFGHGHGMGLSMVQGFVEQSGGVARVTSELGHGTRVRLLFPVADGIAPTLPDDDTPDAEAHVLRGKTILIVEDNLDVRQTVMQQVRQIGLIPIEAEDGSRALQIIEDGVAIDVVLTDTVMPGKVQGLDLVHFLRARPDRPPVVCMSGYDGYGMRPQDDRIDHVDILQKPVSIQTLTRALTRALADTPAQR